MFLVDRYINILWVKKNVGDQPNVSEKSQFRSEMKTFRFPAPCSRLTPFAHWMAVSYL